MPKKKPQATSRDPVERLALLLRQAHIASYVSGNPTPHHPPVEWQEARHAGQSGWHQMARECLKLGLSTDGEPFPVLPDDLARLVEQMRLGQRKHAAAGGALPWLEVEAMERQVDEVVRKILSGGKEEHP